MMRTAHIIVLSTTVALLTGCSTPKRADTAAVELSPRSVTIHHGDGSGVAPWDAVVQDMSSSQVVLIGEMHGHDLGLAVAAELFDDILARNDNAILSMEFYERDQQLAIDDYLAGVTNREAFEKAAQRTAGNNPPGHEQMFEAAKNAGRPVIAANAPRRYTKLARTDGYEALRSLNASQREHFDIPPSMRFDTAYRDRFFDAMGGMASHGGEEMLNGFFRSQAFWDRTMATSIARASWQGTPVVHMVGYFHIQFGSEPGGSGMLDDLHELLQPGAKIVTFVMLDRADQPLKDEDLGIADYVIYVGSDAELGAE